MTDLWNDNLKRLLELTPDGSDSTELSSAMKNFHTAWNAAPRSDAAVDAAVVEIAAALNWDVSKARQAFERFAQKATDESKKDFKDGFIGSKQHLLFGDIVGGVLELPPVFGAMLSPTGGMVGPGPFSFHIKEGILAYHGVAHDSGGYLCRKHTKDPGYEYILDQGGQPCENNALKGQVSGIVFWFNLLNLGWRNFLAVSDPSSFGAAPADDISSIPEPDQPPTSDTTPTGEVDGDGVMLNPAEVRFLQVLISGESDPSDIDLVSPGLESLKRRGLVIGDDQEGYNITDQLVMAMAVTMEPELLLEASPAAFAAATADEQALRFYKWGDYIVEQTTPGQGQIRLAGLSDASHAEERLLQFMPLTESDLEAISLSLTGDEFDTVVSTAAAGEMDPGIEWGIESAASQSASTQAAADLTAALDSEQVVGTIRLQQFEGRTLSKTRDLAIIQGARATWVVSRDPELGDQVNISLITPATIGQELGLSPSADG
jgi:hypothetical protein